MANPPGTVAFSFATVPQIVCEVGSALKLADHVAGTSVLLVTDRGLIEHGVTAPVVEALTARGLTVNVFSDVVADPPESVVEAAFAFAREHAVETVIGLGGGSSMDVAKLIASLGPSRQPLASAYGVGNVREARAWRLLQVPTTAGTGSEVTPISIVTTGETTKMGIVAPQLYADVAVLDASLTLGLPAPVTAATGIDAMVHAIEAFTSAHKKNPISDMLAIQALGLLSRAIRTACADGRNLQARQDMLLGACLAGQAFANAPVAAVHALAYPIGGIFHVPHGLSNSLVLPHVLRFNLPAAAAEYATLARATGLGAMAGSDEAQATGFIAALEAIAADVGIARHLREVGISLQDVARLADDAMLQTRLLVNNPREVTHADALAIYQAAY